MQNLLNKNNIKIAGGTFGLERETLRVTAEGKMSSTLHPFSESVQIVKDFCENQSEINTGVHNSAKNAISELFSLGQRLETKLKGSGEYLWLYSNPPKLEGDDDIPVAKYSGDLHEKHSYRLYLAEKYGKRKMTLSGIHVNYSLSEKLLQSDFTCSMFSDYSEYKNAEYLRVAQGLTEYGWIINLLLSASPICDGSYFSDERRGETIITKYASLRCGEEGYWNQFIPKLRYGSVTDYAQSIQDYIDNGALAGVGELYYPIRLKPKGANRLNNLVRLGVNHIELRNVDINPFSSAGLDERDLRFVELLILWVYAEYRGCLSENDQTKAVQNFKNAALLDIDNNTIVSDKNEVDSVRVSGLRVLEKMHSFFSKCLLEDAEEIIAFQRSKLTNKETRYAEMIIKAFAGEYMSKMLDIIKNHHPYVNNTY